MKEDIDRLMKIFKKYSFYSKEIDSTLRDFLELAYSEGRVMGLREATKRYNK